METPSSEKMVQKPELMTQAGDMLERESETGAVICSSAKEWIFPKKVGRIKAHFPFLI